MSSSLGIFPDKIAFLSEDFDFFYPAYRLGQPLINQAGIVLIFLSCTVHDGLDHFLDHDKGHYKQPGNDKGHLEIHYEQGDGQHEKDGTFGEYLQKR